MSKKLITKLVAIFMFCITAQLEAQESWIDTTIHGGLIELETNYPFEILVSNDSLEIITETLRNLNKAKLYFDEIFQTDLDFAVLFIENREWDKHAYFQPPGIPQAWQGNIILGLDKSVVSLEVESQIKQLPAENLTSLKSAYGENIDLDLFYRETLSIHELAHLYHYEKATKPQRKWLQELFATMSMYAYVKNNCNSCFKLMNTYPEFVLKTDDKIFKYKTLKDFEEKYVQGLGAQNYEWFQMRLYDKAKSIVDSQGDVVLVKFRDFLIQTDLSKNKKLSDSELEIILKKEVGKDIADIPTNWKYK